MKLKSKIVTVATTVLTIAVLVIQLLVPLLQFKASASTQGPPVGAPIVHSNNQEYCTATIENGADFTGYKQVGNGQDTVDQWASNGTTPSSDLSDLKNTGDHVIVGGNKTIGISFSGESSVWDGDCGTALTFMQSVNPKTPSKFYGLYTTLSFKQFINQGPGVHYSNLEGNVTVSGGTYQLSFSLNGQNYKLNLSGKVSSIVSGIGGGSASTGIGCLATSSDPSCLKILGTPTFTNADTITWGTGDQQEVYKATTWEGAKDDGAQYMNYMLTSSTNALRQQSIGGANTPYFELSTDGNGSNSLDINVDHKNDANDIQDIYAGFTAISNGKRNLNLRFKNYDKSGNPLGIATVNANINGFPTVATYYPGAKGDTPTIQLVWPKGGPNEQMYVGNYTKANNATTFQLKATDPTISACNSTNPPQFTLASDPSTASTSGTATVAATWQLPVSDCTYHGSGAPVRVLIAKPGTGVPDLQSPNTTQTSGNAPGIDCSVKFYNPLSWFLCPLATALETVVSGLDDEINNYLDIKPGSASYSSDCSAYKNTHDQQWCGYYTAWAVVRNISFGLIGIFALVAIISEALGFEIFDAYTIRKVLPRLLIAAIGISLSWPLMMAFIGFTNDLGIGVRGLIYAPFNQSATHVALGGGGQFVATFFAAGAIVALGFAGLLSFVATAALAVAVAFLVLTLRQMVITMLVIFAPIAIACYVLPNTSKVWKLWADSFMKGLLMFPIIAAFIAIGRVFAAVNSSGQGSINQIIAFTAYFAPYFLIPFTFRLAGGAISTIAGIANDRGKGAFDRLKKFRGERSAERMSALNQGFKQTKLGGRLAGGKAQQLARLQALGSGAVGVGGIGTSRYRASLENSHLGHMAAVAAESIKNNPSAAANDDANKIARIARDKTDFLNQYYAAKTHAGSTADERAAARAEAMNQLTYTEQAFGAAMGTDQMKHSAATAALSSNSSTDSVAERAQWMRDAVNSHVLSDSQAAALVKQSGSLASSAGFGDLIQAAHGDMSDAELLKRSTLAFNPANSHRMRKGQAQEMAKEVHRQATEAHGNVVAAEAKYGAGSREATDANTKFAKVIADSAGIHDVMNGMTPDVREEYANYMNGATVDGKRMREHESEMESTGNSAYLDRRKTWTAGAAGAAGGAPGGGGGAGGPGAAGGGGGAGGPGAAGGP